MPANSPSPAALRAAERISEAICAIDGIATFESINCAGIIDSELTAERAASAALAEALGDLRCGDCLTRIGDNCTRECTVCASFRAALAAYKAAQDRQVQP